VKLLQEANPDRLIAASQDAALLARAAAVEERVNADLARPAHDGPATNERPIAYFSAEYGFHGSFPIYSGGLGALAGDILKEASDRAWPLAAIGLLYRNGYFRQRIDANAGSTSTGSTPTPTACPPRWSPTTTARRSRST